MRPIKNLSSKFERIDLISAQFRVKFPAYGIAFKDCAGRHHRILNVGSPMSRFGYWRDPLFLVSVAAYALNRWLLKPFFPSPFLHGHFADLLMIPAALPGTLWAQRIAGLRLHDLAPSWAEIFFHLTLWAFICEYVGPIWLRHGTADWWDVAAYAFGGIISCLWWNRRR